MIRILDEPQPAGRYWLDYKHEDTWIVDHFLSGHGWDPVESEVRRFLAIAHMHHTFVEVPDSLA